MAPTADPETLLDDALAQLHFAFRAVVREPDRILATHGLGRVHHRILFFVRRSPGASVGELLSVLGVTKQSLHRPMQQLVDGGFLQAERSTESRRTKVLTLTRRGVAFERKLTGMQRDALAQAFATVPAAGVRAWHRVMEQLGRDENPAARDV